MMMMISIIIISTFLVNKDKNNIPVAVAVAGRRYVGLLLEVAWSACAGKMRLGERCSGCSGCGGRG